MPVLEDYAIVVGVNDYGANSGIDSLQGCVKDAQLFAQWLQDPQGGGFNPNPPQDEEPRRLRLICSPTPLHPVKDDVEGAIIKLIKKHQQTGRKVGRRLYLWFSGHGVTPSRSADECALLMANAELAMLGRSVPGRKAADSLRNLAMFEEVVLFMDCCRGVAGLDEAFLSYNHAADPSVGQNVKWFYGFATKWAAHSAERLLPDPLDPAGPRSWHGVFTHAVLEGLRKGVDPSGRVTSDSLAKYVRERCQQLLPAEDNQRPDIPPPDPDRLIVFGSPGISTQATVRLTNPAGGFQVRDGSNISQVLRNVPGPASQVVSLPLSPGWYLFAAPATGNSFTVSCLVEILGDPVDVNL